MEEDPQRNILDFWWIAQGSVNELETHIILSDRVGLSKQEDVEPIISLLREESRMIIALPIKARIIFVSSLIPLFPYSLIPFLLSSLFPVACSLIY